MQKATQGNVGRFGEARIPAWGWFLPGIVLLIVFAVLYDNGALLAPLVGESAYANNYLHEVFHDGRHLLGVPCH
ncbi:CbtB domain-containing protein [Rubrobacter indicoceani]|uniref:CbtB domain-containing protein n=1 Tax=Rubrobacter indicoceani TaxID=2051957 RepID=UPI000E5B12F5|nr:CbtB-domain containing protein [Rubrobacter indicoceani]